MNHVKGDLLKLAREGLFDVIAHGCNCFCTTGAGIAKGIAATFPQAYAADRQTTKDDRHAVERTKRSRDRLQACSWSKSG